MWTCPKCGEAIEGQFDSCWKCAGKEGQTAAPAQPAKPLELTIAALISYLIPWLALLLVMLPIGQAPGYFDLEIVRDARSWLWMLIPAVLNFFILRSLSRFPIVSRLAAYLLFLGWVFIMMLFAPATIKSGWVGSPPKYDTLDKFHGAQ
jgi:hypothetical protein